MTRYHPVVQPYRDMDGEVGRPAQWRYGRFRWDWGWWALVVFSLLLSAVVAYLGGRSGSLSCRRGAGGGHCTLTTKYGFIPFDRTRFSIAAVREVTLSQGWSDDDYAEIWVGDQRRIFYGAGKSTTDRVHRFFFDQPDQPTLDQRTLPPLSFGFVLVPLFLVVFALAKFVAMVRRRPSTVDLALFDREAVEVTERWLGRAWRKRTVSLRGAVEIRVVHTTIPGFTDAHVAGLVSVIDGDETVRPLTSYPLPGTEIHDRLAARLAEATGCEVNRIVDREP